MGYGDTTYTDDTLAPAQNSLSDFLEELKARGFDGFSEKDLTRYVNRGYNHVARRSTWTWEETQDTIILPAGNSYVSLWPTVAGKLPNFRSLDRLYVTTAGQERRLVPLSDDAFFTQWLNRNLTATSARGEPTSYYVHGNRLYILPPANSDRSLEAHYHQRVSPLVSPDQKPITPPYLDEAILLAALIRCHRRAHEPVEAQSVEADLNEFFDDMANDESNVMEEQPDRVAKDDTWL